MNIKEIRSRIKQLEIYLYDEAMDDLLQDYDIRLIHDELNHLKLQCETYNNNNNAALTD